MIIPIVAAVAIKLALKKSNQNQTEEGKGTTEEGKIEENKQSPIYASDVSEEKKVISIQSPIKRYYINNVEIDGSDFKKRITNISCDVLVTLYYKDGNNEQRYWKVDDFKSDSSLSANLHSGYLRDWQQKGIVKIELKILKQN